MVKIRFRRVGLKRQPSYRIVVVDSRKARDGAFIEIIGHHNPRTRPETNVVKEERALYWMSVGAQPSDAVRRVFQRTGTMDRFARFRAGEATIEELAQEAAEALADAEPNPGKTSFPAPAAGESKIKAREAALAAAEAEGGEAAEG
ncbi:MAG: 30S ribosomal protein S16 [Chloroflexota bacterium]